MCIMTQWEVETKWRLILPTCVNINLLQSHTNYVKWNVVRWKQPMGKGRHYLCVCVSVRVSVCICIHLYVCLLVGLRSAHTVMGSMCVSLSNLHHSLSLSVHVYSRDASVHLAQITTVWLTITCSRQHHHYDRVSASRCTASLMNHKWVRDKIVCSVGRLLRTHRVLHR